ncbi:GNAT family N-acetyltransferase [Paenibacillus sp. CAU 1782]
MQELTSLQFGKVRPLLQGGHLHPEILSVIEGRCPGWIFADNADHPGSALVWSKGMQGFYLLGDCRNAVFTEGLDSFATHTLEPRMRRHGLTHFEISGHHDEWDLEGMFASRNLYDFEQLVFETERKTSVVESKGYIALPLHQNSEENRWLFHTPLVKEHIEAFWTSVEAFKYYGFGYAAVAGTEVIGLCYTSCRANDRFAIGVETAPQSRGNGIGTHLASLVAGELLDSGFIPYWDCTTDNTASKKLALRLGFQLVHHYRCIGFSL